MLLRRWWWKRCAAPSLPATGDWLLRGAGVWTVSLVTVTDPKRRHRTASASAGSLR
jgi:hypothetical protein